LTTPVQKEPCVNPAAAPLLGPGRWLVVSDLDGCLLDADTYSWAEARPALAELARSRTPLVLCSGKTRMEMEALARDLGLAHPFIVENGGAIVFPLGSFDGDVPGARSVEGLRVLALGPPRELLVAALRELAQQTGARVRGFADMTANEVRSLTGLSGTAALLALDREYDEPFVVEDEATLAELSRAAQGRGLQLSHGGRFHHLMGGSDKGLAVRTLLALYHRAGRDPRSAGLGDAETDLPLLQAVDRPIVVPRRDGSLNPVLAAGLPRAEQAPGPGPAGWNAALLALLRGHDLPRIAAGAEEGPA
jgi:mannosyl-3-phosphoglycerate phosphatase